MADERKCTECANAEGTLFDALSCIVWYDCHYEWLKCLRDELAEHPGGLVYMMPRNIEWHSEKHTIMMLLVGMFGNWGTSIRSGWIDDKKGCIEFIERLCGEYWEVENL